MPVPRVAAGHPEHGLPRHLRQRRPPRRQRPRTRLLHLPANLLGRAPGGAHRLHVAVAVRDGERAARGRGAAGRALGRGWRASATGPGGVQREPGGRVQRAGGGEPAVHRRRRAVPGPGVRGGPERRVPAGTARGGRRRPRGRVQGAVRVLQAAVPADADDADRQGARAAELPRARRAQGRLLPARDGRRRRRRTAGNRRRQELASWPLARAVDIHV